MSLCVRIIPCLDVADGRVVKGTKFQDLRDAGEPVALAQRYEREGADELTVLDVSATPQGRAHGHDVVRALRAALALPLTVGGGVRSRDDARALLLAGADKVAVNTAAAARPELLRELAQEFGRQCTVLALDAARAEGSSGYELVTHSGRTRTGRDALAWAQQACALGAGEIVLTSFDRDGTGLGYDLDLIAQISAAVDVPVVASGGARSAADMLAALRAGAAAVLAAGIFHRGEVGIAALKAELAQAGIAVRPPLAANLEAAS